MTYSSIYTGAQVDDAVNRRHTQNTDTALDTGGPNAITAAVLAELANAERRDQFYDSLLKPAGLTVAPDVLYWPSPYRADQMDAAIARPGTGTRFNSQGVLETIGAEIIRRDYDPVGGFRGALAEPQRANAVIWSEDFSNAVWVKTGGSVTANSIAAPDAETTADTFTAADANATLLQGVTTTAVPWTFSVFLRRKTGTGAVEITMDGTTYVAQTISAAAWTRCIVTQTGVEGTSNCGIRLAAASDEVYVWGAQAE